MAREGNDPHCRKKKKMQKSSRFFFFFFLKGRERKEREEERRRRRDKIVGFGVGGTKTLLFLNFSFGEAVVTFVKIDKQ